MGPEEGSGAGKARGRARALKRGSPGGFLEAGTLKLGIEGWIRV